MTLTCEPAQILMMKQVDGQIDEDEARQLQAHRDGCATCSAELEDFMEQKAVTDLLRERIQYDAALDSYWGGVYNRLEQKIGWVLIIAGTCILSGFGLTQLLLESDVPLWMRIGVGSLAAGTLVMLVSVIRWRLVTGKKDKYTEVIR